MVRDFSGKKNKYSQKQGYSGNRKVKSGFAHGLKLMLLFFLILLGGIGVSLVQAGLSGKQVFWSRLELFVNFANPTKRFVYIYPGMRKEEIAQKYADTLNWSDKDKRWFIASAPVDATNGGFEEGYFLPKAYIVDKDATGKEVGSLMHQEFLDAIAEKVLPLQGPKLKASIESIIGDDKNAVIKSLDSISNGIGDAARKSIKSPDDLDLDTAVRIASIIQREAAGPHDMRLISGIIWNRISKGMSLELDATLQYVKGTEDNWWPIVKSKDKYLDSPYNTYKYRGVPPGAISNPSIDAINAVYNPQKTDCIFYLHGRNRQIHCSKSYEQHLENIRAYL